MSKQPTTQELIKEIDNLNFKIKYLNKTVNDLKIENEDLARENEALKLTISVIEKKTTEDKEVIKKLVNKLCDIYELPTPFDYILPIVDLEV